MKKPTRIAAFAMTALLIFFSTQLLLAQDAMASHDHDYGQFNIVLWFGMLELPFLFLCVVYSFKTAAALKGGVFGQGMNYLAWGFLVMAVGHIAMQINHVFHYDIFRQPFGTVTGSILWFIALMITWGLSAVGFYSIYKVSKQE